jgi:hypothetical protein
MNALLARGLLRQFIPSVRVPNDAKAGIIIQHAGNPPGSVFRPVRNGDLARM